MDVSVIGIALWKSFSSPKSAESVPMFQLIHTIAFLFLCFSCLLFTSSWIYQQRLWSWKNVGFGLLFIALIGGEGSDLYFWSERFAESSVPILFNLIEASFQFVFGAMVLGLLYFDYRYDLEQAEKESILEELETSLKEKNILLSEIHHRVKNNLQVMLSMIRLRRRNNDNETSREQLKKLESKILSIAMIHETLYQQDEHTYVNTDVYFRDLVQEIAKLYEGEDKQHLNCEIDGLKLEMGQAISCGIVLAELIFNAYEHAYEGNETTRGIFVDVTHEENNQVQVTVMDNGKELLDEEAFWASDSLGHQIVKNVTEDQLGGELKLRNGNKQGISIQFPTEGS